MNSNGMAIQFIPIDDANLRYCCIRPFCYRVTRDNYSSINNKSLKSWQKYFLFAGRCAQSLCNKMFSEHTKSKGATSRDLSCVCCENQPVSTHRFMEHSKQGCTQNSERLLWMLEDERSRKITSSREGTVLVDRCTEDWLVPLLWHYQIWQS